MVGDILLGIVSFCTFISYLPQIMKLLKTKKSEDLNIVSWAVWVVSNFSYLLYAFLCSKEFMLRFETALEFTFCLLILMLTVHYRKSNKK